MDDLNLLLRYATRLLIWVAPLEFLLGRAISRASRQMPAGDIGAAIFSAISTVGAFLVMPALILVLLVILLAAVLALRGAGPGAPHLLARPGDEGVAWPRPLPWLLIGFLVLSVVLLVPEAPAQVLIIYNLCSAGLICGMAALFALRARTRPAVRLTVGLFGLAYLGYYVYAISATLAQGNGVGTGDLGVTANAIGEGIGMAAALSLFWTAGLVARPVGTPRPRRLWLILAGVSALLLLITPLFEQWLQGVATQFSVGFTLWLPVPITALALAGWVYAVLAFCSRQARAVSALPWAADFGAGLLLLPAAGYALQLNYQHLLLAAVFLLWTGLLRPLSESAPAPEAGRPARQDAGSQQVA